MFNIYPVENDSCTRNLLDFIKNIASGYNNSQILDVGCGKGDHTKIFCINNNWVTGLDIHDYRQPEFKSMFEFKIYNGQKFPFKSNNFDLISCIDVIEHVEKDKLLISEMIRCLRKTGKLIITTPNRNRLSMLVYKILGHQINYPLYLGSTNGLGDIIHIREYSMLDFIKIIPHQKFLKTQYFYFWLGLRPLPGWKRPLIFKNLCQYLIAVISK